MMKVDPQVGAHWLLSPECLPSARVEAMPVFRLSKELIFPEPELADETGLLAVGGDLSPERLVLAYANGIFPWPHEGMPLLWFSPDLRMVVRPSELIVSRRLRRTIRRGRFTISLDSSCREVIAGCATTVRKGENGTWITRQMAEAYGKLHDLGFVHSVEARLDGSLVGGLYGISLGGTFMGESMFTRVSDASKVCLAKLAYQLERWSFDLIDVQIHTDHLARFGATEWSRSDYLKLLDISLERPTRRGRWVLDDDLK